MRKNVPITERQMWRIFFLNMVRWRRIKNKTYGIMAGCECARVSSRYGCFASLQIRK